MDGPQADKRMCMATRSTIPRTRESVDHSWNWGVEESAPSPDATEIPVACLYERSY
jgi:hypothetical protein